MPSAPKKTSSPPELDEGELELFVSKALKAVITGIEEAERFTRPIGSDIVVHIEGDPKGHHRIIQPLAHQISFGIPEEICFDVAVNVTRKSGKNGGLKIEVMSVGANVGGESAREYSTASRVSFKIPVGKKH